MKCHKYNNTHWFCISIRDISLCRPIVLTGRGQNTGSSTSVDLSDYSESICFTPVCSSLYIIVTSVHLNVWSSSAKISGPSSWLYVQQRAPCDYA